MLKPCLRPGWPQWEMIQCILPIWQQGTSGFAKDLLKTQEAGEEAGDVSYWEWSSFQKFYDHIFKDKSGRGQKSMGNKLIENFTVKDILFQPDNIWLGNKLIAVQIREINNKEMLTNGPYSLCTTKPNQTTTTTNKGQLQRVSIGNYCCWNCIPAICLVYFCLLQ